MKQGQSLTIFTCDVVSVAAGFPEHNGYAVDLIESVSEVKPRFPLHLLQLSLERCVILVVRNVVCGELTFCTRVVIVAVTSRRCHVYPDKRLLKALRGMMKAQLFSLRISLLCVTDEFLVLCVQFLDANFNAALTWTSNDTHQPVPCWRVLFFFPCSRKPFVSAASFRMNRLMPIDPRKVLRLKCSVSFTVYRSHFQQPLYAITFLREWLVLKFVVGVCHQGIAVNRHRAPSPEDRGEWVKV